jgi:NitT/TauT family transport system permease protein
MLYVTLGLGQLLVAGRDLNDINQVVVVMVLIAGIGYAVDAILFQKLETSLRDKWGTAIVAAN